MKKILYYIVLALLLIVFCISAWQVGSYYLQSIQQKKQYDDLAAMVESARKAAAASEAAASTESVSGESVPGESIPGESTPEETVPEETAPEILPEYKLLYEENPHLVGWIQIEDTVINYPVMQTPEEPDYYLYRDFYEKDSSQGCIYAEELCDFSEPSDNITIYGHYMKDGSMFASLSRYQSETFWEKHDTILLDSIWEKHSYRIFAVFTIAATIDSEFPYHNFVDAADEEEFDSFVSQCKELSFYDTGITPEYGDKLICLSTCEYSQQNGRLVVAAVRVD